MEKTLEVLHKSLLALSNCPMNIPDAAAQLSATRFAILKMEGIEIDKIEYAEYLAAAKMRADINRGNYRLMEDRQRLKMELAELETEIEGKKSLLKEFMEYQKEQDELKERGI